ncbi:MAG: YihY/virulence factor BrkB family protein [Elusimicrobia bacterium]|nr:YihY/virulence factor BrkB family protein [Elusimicrobiota bacterium]
MATIPDPRAASDGGRLGLLEWWAVFRDTYLEWGRDNGPQMGAALAFYTFFSLAPLLIIVIAVAGLAFGERAAQGQIMGQIQNVVGLEAARAIEWSLSRARRPEGGALAVLIGFGTLFAGASGVVMALQNALNTIWRAQAPSGIIQTVKRYAYSYALVLGLGFLSVVSLLINTGVAAVGKFLVEYLPFREGIMQGIEFALTYLMIATLFATMFHWLSNARPSWSDCRIGASVTAALFVGGKYALGLYLGRRAIGSMYGAAGSLVIILLWVYYSSQILFMGVEFTKVYSRRRARLPAPSAPKLLPIPAMGGRR